MRKFFPVFCVMSLAGTAAMAGPHWTEPYNVVWTTPSRMRRVDAYGKRAGGG